METTMVTNRKIITRNHFYSDQICNNDIFIINSKKRNAQVKAVSHPDLRHIAHLEPVHFSGAIFIR